MGDSDVIFQHTVEGLFAHGIPEQVTPRLKDRLRTIGVDLDRRLDPAYPRSVWNQVLHITREEAFSTLTEEQGFFQLGRRTVEGYTETLLGRAAAALAKVIGPRRTLSRMSHNLRSAGNYNQTRFSELPDGGVALWVNEAILSPQFLAGIIEASARIAGAKDVRVEVAQTDDSGCTYHVHWS